MTLLNLQFLPSPSKIPFISSNPFTFPQATNPHLLSLPPFPNPLIPSQFRRISLNCHRLERQDAIFSQKDDDLGENSEVFKKTLRLVECSMFASIAGLAYFLSNSLAIENYFSCFFSLPIVISSMRWGLGAGRKTMVATAMLLLTLSGPVKALTYLLMHGLVGLTMGTLWKLGTNWSVSIAVCAFVRALGAIGYVLISSFLIRENILEIITINIHASLTYILLAIRINTIPTMDTIYLIFGSLLLLNCGFFVFLLHILYAVFLSKLGMKESLTLPQWLEKAI